MTISDTTEAATRRYVTARAVCDLLDIDRRTLTRLIAEQGLPVVRITPQLHRYDLDAVYAWIDSRWSTRAPGDTAAGDEAAA